MPNMNDVLREIQQEAGTHGDAAADIVRRKYLAALTKHTGRNTIAYYSGFLTSNPNNPHLSVNDVDKNSFMAAVHGFDFEKGLDLILHTPGGDIGATESLVDYLHQLFDKNIRVLVPQIAMSAGTMIACSAKEIIMGKQSSLGPIDPQIRGIPAIGVLAELDKAAKDIEENPHKIEIWRVILNKYNPTLIVSCEQAIEWAKEFVESWLTSTMFEGDAQGPEKAARVISLLSEFDHTRNHSRHFNMNKCRDIGLNVTAMEDDDNLQDLLLSVHHCYMHVMDGGRIAKMVENHLGMGQIRIITA